MTTASQLKAPQRAVAVTARVALRHVLGLDLRVAGLSHLPSHPHIVAHNLVSPLDAFIVALALEEAGHDAPVILLDYELARIPLLSWLLTSGALAVDKRVGPEGHDDPFGVATRALWDGHCVVSAPEQVVSTSLEVLPVRTGPLRLATAADSALVAAAVFGGHRLFDGDGKMRLRRRGAAVGVTFGVPTPAPSGPDELAMAQRMLQFDLEALLSQTLDDYPDREEGQAGAAWWPARRGGSAPDLLDTLEATDTPTPTIELWADDRTVVDTRRALLSSTVQSAPDVATWVLDDDDDDDDEPARQVAAARPTVPAREPLPDPEPLQTDASLLEATQPESAGAEPEPAVPDAAAPEPYVPDEVPDVPAMAAPMPAAPPTPPPNPVEVDGLLSFDLPGMPRKVLRQTRLEARGDGLLAVHVEAADTAMLKDVTIDRRDDKTLFVGLLQDEYRVTSGDLMVDVPAGTQATLVAIRGTSRAAATEPGGAA